MYTQVASRTLCRFLVSCFRTFLAGKPKERLSRRAMKSKPQIAHHKDSINLVQGTYLLPLHLTVLKYVIKFIQTRSKSGK